MGIHRMASLGIIWSLVWLTGCGKTPADRQTLVVDEENTSGRDFALTDNLEISTGELPGIGSVRGCTAILVDRSWILTSSRCLGAGMDTPSQLEAGFNGESRFLDQIVRAPSTIAEAKDVVLGHLAQAIDNVQALRLFLGTFEGGEKVQVVGYGKADNQEGRKLKSQALFHKFTRPQQIPRLLEVKTSSGEEFPCVQNNGIAVVSPGKDQEWRLVSLLTDIDSQLCHDATWGSGVFLADLAQWLAETTGQSPEEPVGEEPQCRVSLLATSPEKSTFRVTTDDANTVLQTIIREEGGEGYIYQAKNAPGDYVVTLYWKGYGSDFQAKDTYLVRVMDKFSGRVGSCRFIPSHMQTMPARKKKTAAAASSCEPPVVSLGHNRIVRYGASITLGPAPDKDTTYHWKKDGRGIPEAVSSQWSFIAESSSTYEVLASNACGQAQGRVALIVRK